MNSDFTLPMPYTSQETLSTFAKWLCQLEYICDHNEELIIPDLINHSYQFNQLVSLSVYFNTASQIIPFALWSHHLNNAPALKILKLTNFRIELGDIKALHANAPLITTLVLAEIEFLITENLDSRLPEPSMVEALSIKDSLGSFSDQELWVLYFLKNYVCLRDFIFEYDDPEIDENIPEEPALNTIIALEDHIQSFRTNLETRGYHELEELNRKDLGLNDFEFSLDRSGDFRFNGDELVRRCDMFKHLQTLDIRDFNPKIFEMIKEFASLKHLTLQFPYSRHTFKTPTISLNTLLIHQCPNQLESLCIRYAIVTASLDDTQILQVFKTLKVYSGRVDDAASEFLSNQCPSLLQLEFSETALLSSSIKLPSHNMDLLKISIPCSINYVVRVIQDGNVRLYSTGSHHDMLCCLEKDDLTLYSGIKPYQPRDVDKVRFFDFICQSIRTVIINGYVTV
jgi:hypothetical protein